MKPSVRELEGGQIEGEKEKKLKEFEIGGREPNV